MPLLPGSQELLQDAEEAEAMAAEIGFPVILKAAAGGGGRGMRIVREAEASSRGRSPPRARGGSRRSATAIIYIEKYVEKPRHIEFQVVGDEHGNVIHLGERECSIQRRHQKLIEESPVAGVSPGAARGDGRASSVAALRGDRLQQRWARSSS